MIHPAKRSSRSLRKLANDVTGTIGTRVIITVFGLLTGIITARVLGPENRGIFSLVSLFPASLVTLSKFGQAQATVYFIRRERSEIAQVTTNVLVFALAVGAVLIGVVVGLRDHLLTSFLHGVPLWSLMVVLPLIPVLLVESYLQGVLQATDRFRIFNARVLWESVLTLVGMVVVLLWARLGLAGALGVVIVVRFAMAIWLVVTVHAGTPLRARLDWPLLRRMLRYGSKSHVQIIASHFHFRADMYLVAYFLSPAHVAFYSIAARLAEQIMYVPQSLGLALFPRLAAASETQVHSITARACRQTFAMTLGVAAGLMLLGKLAIVAWYGRAYAPAAEPLPYVCVGIVMMSLYVLLSRSFTSRDRQFVNIVAAYTALIGNISLNLLLIPAYGITGAAMATAVSYTLSALMLLVFFLRESGLAWHEVIFLRRSDLAMWKRLLLDVWADFRPARA